MNHKSPVLIIVAKVSVITHDWVVMETTAMYYIAM